MPILYQDLAKFVGIWRNNWVKVGNADNFVGNFILSPSLKCRYFLSGLSFCRQIKKTFFMIPIFVLNFDKIRRQMKKYTWNADTFNGPLILSANKENILYEKYRYFVSTRQNSSANKEIILTREYQFFC